MATSYINRIDGSPFLLLVNAPEVLRFHFDLFQIGRGGDQEKRETLGGTNGEYGYRERLLVFGAMLYIEWTSLPVTSVCIIFAHTKGLSDNLRRAFRWTSHQAWKITRKWNVR